QTQVVQQRREGRVRGVVLLDTAGVAALLRQHGARHAAQGEQEQQDQRDPHRGGLPPAPLEPVGEPERAARRVPVAGPGLVRLGRRLERVRLRRTHIGHERTTWARMSVSSCWVAGPNTAPAMCPVRSMTSVVGVPAMGTTDVKSSVITEPESLTLGYG